MKYVCPEEIRMRNGALKYLDELRMLARNNRKNPTEAEKIFWIKCWNWQSVILHNYRYAFLLKNVRKILVFPRALHNGQIVISTSFSVISAFFLCHARVILSGIHAFSVLGTMFFLSCPNDSLFRSLDVWMHRCVNG